MTYKLTFVFLFASLAIANASGSDAPTRDRYDTVIRTQYAAQTPITTLPADEAQRIHDIYLKSIGQKSKDLTATVTEESDNPPR
jgi:hypothetical protein